MIQIDPIDRSHAPHLLQMRNLSEPSMTSPPRPPHKCQELSEKSGIAQSSLYKILHGKRSPNLSTLRAIIHSLRQLYRSTEGNLLVLSLHDQSLIRSRSGPLRWMHSASGSVSIRSIHGGCDCCASGLSARVLSQSFVLRYSQVLLSSLSVYRLQPLSP